MGKQSSRKQDDRDETSKAEQEVLEKRLADLKAAHEAMQRHKRDKK